MKPEELISKIQARLSYLQGRIDIDKLRLHDIPKDDYINHCMDVGERNGLEKVLKLIKELDR